MLLIVAAKIVHEAPQCDLTIAFKLSWPI